MGFAQRITFGFTDEPQSFMKAADCFVLPSRYEGFSNVLIESLACGTPAVVTDCPGANREVIVEGQNGWFASSEDADSLANTMVRAIDASASINSRQLIDDCLERFGLETIIPSYEAAIRGKS